EYLLSCLERLQKVLSAASLPSLFNHLESVAKQKGLDTHLSPTSTACYITSDLFYLEIQIEPDGHVIDVIIAHHGETPESCEELVQLLRMKNFDDFAKSLEGLSNLYQVPGDRKIKTKVYQVLKSLEMDLNTMADMYRFRKSNADRVTTILQGPVGYFVPRNGGNPTTLEYFISPYDQLEKRLEPGTIIIFSSTAQISGMKVFVTVEGISTSCKLPITPLIQNSQQDIDRGIPTFAPLTEEVNNELPACFFLKFPEPFPMLIDLIQKIQNLTGLSVMEQSASVSFYELLAKSEMKSPIDPNKILNLFQMHVILYNLHHSYVLYMDKEKPLLGTLVSKIPFTHPMQVSSILDILRHQAAYNLLVGSCISEKRTKNAAPELHHFEVHSLNGTSFSVSFWHPFSDNLTHVVFDVLNSRQISCELHTEPAAAASLGCSEEFISRVVHYCMSIPITMRAILKKAAKIPEDCNMLTETV
uniref:Mediator of RNA polymerase II transcription subunit 1 n=1 Tax=Latimeria chalumnae TaxID=7897 RepID=H3AM65_LATCH